MFPGVIACDVFKLLSSGSENKGVSKSEGEVREREGNGAAYKYVINLGERNSGASSYNFPVSLNFTKILSLLPKRQNVYFKKLEKGQQQIRIRGYLLHGILWQEMEVFLAKYTSLCLT